MGFDKARAWIGEKLILLGVKLVGVPGASERLPFVRESEEAEGLGEDDYDGMPVYPAVAMTELASQMVRDGRRAETYTAPPTRGPKPLVGSLRDRALRARGDRT